MEWADILVPAASVISIVAGLIMRLRSRPLARSIRSRLRNDLEILKMLQDTHHHKYQMVRSQVDALIEEVYKQPLKGKEKGGEQPLEREGLKKLRPREWTLFIMGIIAFVGFFIWSWQIWRDPFNLWVVGTGFGSFAGISWIVLSYQKLQRDVVTYANRAVRYIKEERYELAISDCDKAIESDPNYATTYFNRAAAYNLQGKKAEAIADYEKFITLTDNPESIEEAKQQIEELSR